MGFRWKVELEGESKERFLLLGVEGGKGGKASPYSPSPPASSVCSRLGDGIKAREARTG